MLRFVVFTSAIIAVAFSGVVPKDLWRGEGRIIGGEDTTIGEYPYVVSIKRFNRHHCGGSIINAKTILTAAHCVIDIPPRQLKVLAGSSYANRDGFKYSIDTIKYPQKFTTENMDKDIALIILDLPLDFSEFIAPIPIAEYEEEVPLNSLAHVVGWGSTSEQGDSPTQLQHVSVRITDQGQCKEAYTNLVNVTEHMLCATDFGKDSCQGDSGGPLTIDGKLVGIVSWGYGCARPNYPGVYTRVASLRKWIDNNLEN